MGGVCLVIGFFIFWWIANSWGMAIDTIRKDWNKK